MHFQRIWAISWVASLALGVSAAQAATQAEITAWLGSLPATSSLQSDSLGSDNGCSKIVIDAQTSSFQPMSSVSIGERDVLLWMAKEVQLNGNTLVFSHTDGGGGVFGGASDGSRRLWVKLTMKKDANGKLAQVSFVQESSASMIGGWSVDTKIDCHAASVASESASPAISSGPGSVTRPL